MTIKTFKGQLADGGQDQIYLAGGDGSTGYRVVKFQAMGTSEDEDYESTLQLFSARQDAVTAAVDFRLDQLIGAILYGDDNAVGITSVQTIIFDNAVFNQDMFVTFKSATSSANMNYYIELEEVRMSDAEAANVNFVAALTHT